jgi:ABC-2 type transport system ATP-binding protein
MAAGSSQLAPVIRATKLVKNYGSFRALDGLDLAVVPGEVHGFLGPNGAGKSTTIRILLGLLRRSGGEVQLFSADPWEHAVELHRRLAYIPGDVNLWPNLSGGEAIDLLGGLRGGLDKTRRGELLERFKLDPTKKCGTYSKGNRQKVAIVAAMASDVELYIMDEPTSGLDPLMQAVFNEEVAKLKAGGKTVLLSSHVLSEVEELCDRLTIIKEGRAVETGTLAGMRHLARVTVDVHTRQPIADLSKLEGLQDVRVNGRHATLKVSQGNLDQLMRHLTLYSIESLTCTPPTLEELFMRYYNGETHAIEAEAR